MGNNGTRSTWLDKTKKNEFTVNKLEEDIDHALAFETNKDKCKQVRDTMSLSRFSISKL